MDTPTLTNYLPFTVYTNLGKLIEYRKLELVSGDATKIAGGKPRAGVLLSQEDFTPAIQYNGYIMIEAKDGPQRERRHPKGMAPGTKNKLVKTIIILLDKDSTYVSAAQQFVKLLNHVPKIKEPERDFNMDILLITYDSLGTNILNKFDEYTTLGSENAGYIRILPYEYKLFTSERMKHKSIPPSRVITREEEKKVVAELFADKKDLPKMRVIEPVAVWLGAEVGDMIEELIPSEAAGVETKYRVVRS
jgi:DNA-directed RNA polymerase subunit H (RpoH/RPB5)